MSKESQTVESLAGDLIEYVGNRVSVLNSLPMLNEGEEYELEWGTELLERGEKMGITPMNGQEEDDGE